MCVTYGEETEVTEEVSEVEAAVEEDLWDFEEIPEFAEIENLKAEELIASTEQNGRNRRI